LKVLALENKCEDVYHCSDVSKCNCKENENMQVMIPVIIMCAFIALFINNNKIKKKADEDKYTKIPEDPKVVFAYMAWKRGEINKDDLDRIKAESAERMKKEAETTKASDIKKLN